jgi:hypothetical protein
MRDFSAICLLVAFSIIGGIAVGILAFFVGEAL